MLSRNKSYIIIVHYQSIGTQYNHYHMPTQILSIPGVSPVVDKGNVKYSP